MCRARYVEAELDRVMGRIAKLPVSSDDKSAAVNTVADHWSELTIVHPFRDGNSRTQRFFFDQMLRTSGWAVDWTRIDAAEAHAARYVGAATAAPHF
nr:Fic family protein [Corynebacterium sp. HMSC034E11]